MPTFPKIFYMASLVFILVITASTATTPNFTRNNGHQESKISSSDVGPEQLYLLSSASLNTTSFPEEYDPGFHVSVILRNVVGGENANETIATKNYLILASRDIQFQSETVREKSPTHVTSLAEATEETGVNGTSLSEKESKHTYVKRKTEEGDYYAKKKDHHSKGTHKTSKHTKSKGEKVKHKDENARYKDEKVKHKKHKGPHKIHPTRRHPPTTTAKHRTRKPYQPPEEQCSQNVKRNMMTACKWGQSSYRVPHEGQYEKMDYCCAAHAMDKCLDRLVHRYDCAMDVDMKMFQGLYQDGFSYLDCPESLKVNDTRCVVPDSGVRTSPSLVCFVLSNIIMVVLNRI